MSRDGRQHHTVTVHPNPRKDFVKVRARIPFPLKGLYVNSYVNRTIFFILQFDKVLVFGSWVFYVPFVLLFFQDD